MKNPKMTNFEIACEVGLVDESGSINYKYVADNVSRYMRYAKQLVEHVANGEFPRIDQH